MLQADGRYLAADVVGRSRVAMAAPCYNGEAAIGKVVRSFRTSLRGGAVAAPVRGR